VARKLFTDFVKVATSGPTIDGREISATDITDMAESYDQEEYTANIWYEHIRYFGNLGKVIEVKAEEDSKGRMCLFAKIAPSDELIYLNNNGQKLFTSIEIQPDFAKTGKAYLAGLAVTDSPASLGTSELQFSNRAQLPENYFSTPVALEHLELENNQGPLSRFMQKLTKSTDDKQDSKTMDKEQFQQLLDAFNTQTQASSALLEKFTSLEEKLAAKEEPQGGDEETPETGVSQEAFSQLQTQFNELQEKFNKLSEEEVPGTETDPAGGDAEKVEVI